MYIKGMKPEIENLIIKFLTKEADLHELQQLEMWISNPKNERLFSEYVKTNMVINREIFPIRGSKLIIT